MALRLTKQAAERIIDQSLFELDQQIASFDATVRSTVIKMAQVAAPPLGQTNVGTQFPPFKPTNPSPSSSPSPTPAAPSSSSPTDLTPYIQQVTQQLQKSLSSLSTTVSKLDGLQQQVSDIKQKYEMSKTTVNQQYRRVQDIMAHLQNNFHDNPMIQRLIQWWGQVVTKTQFGKSSPTQLAQIFGEASKKLNSFVNFPNSWNNDKNQWMSGRKMLTPAPHPTSPYKPTRDMASRVRKEQRDRLKSPVPQTAQPEEPKGAWWKRFLGADSIGKFYKVAGDSTQWCWKLQ